LSCWLTNIYLIQDSGRFLLKVSIIINIICARPFLWDSVKEMLSFIRYHDACPL
jgi:hypothetical protein